MKQPQLKGFRFTRFILLTLLRIVFREYKRGEAFSFMIIPPCYPQGSLKGHSLFRNHIPLPLVKGKGIKGIGLLDNKLYSFSP
jgi:hypothetical protein